MYRTGRLDSGPTNNRYDLMSPWGLKQVIQDAYTKYMHVMYDILSRMGIANSNITNCVYCENSYKMFFLNERNDEKEILYDVLQHVVYHHCLELEHNIVFNSQINHNGAIQWYTMNLEHRPSTRGVYQRMLFRNRYEYSKHIVAALVSAYKDNGSSRSYNTARVALDHKPELLMTVMNTNYVADPCFESGKPMSLQAACARELAKPMIMDILYYCFRFHCHLQHRSNRSSPNYMNVNP